MSQPVIDPWVNVSMGDHADEPFLQAVKQDYFKAGEDFFRNIESQELVATMDALGVEKALVTVDANDPNPRVLDFASDHPTRCFLAAVPDLSRGIRGLWELEALARAHPVALARVAPFQIGVPPDDALYVPLYVKCIELGLPVGINTGICGPPLPSECQHPRHLDTVCHRFRELTIVMQHGADPWWDYAIRLMIKYRNLYLMTSAWAPRYLPDTLLHFMRTRGGQRILFASDHPVLPMERCVEEARALPLPDDVLADFLYGNAERVLFSRREPRYGPLAIDARLG